MSHPVAVVTGASSGIGRAFAEELAARGRGVVLVGRDRTVLEEVAKSLPPDAAHEVLPADLSTDAGVDVVVDRLRASSRPVDLLVNAAGLGTTKPFPDAPLVQEKKMLAVNVTAVLTLSHVAAHVMRTRGTGGIVNVASTAGHWSVGTYAGSKSWVLLVSQGLAAVLAGSGVRVLVVSPGFTRTAFHTRSRTDASGVRPWLWITPERVAREALDALDAGRTTCVPSRRYKTLVFLAGHLSPSLRRWMLGRLATLRPVDE